MNLRGLSKALCFTLILGCALVPAFSQSAPSQPVDKMATLKKARQAYYSLKEEGFAQFQCAMEPNWEALLADQRKADPESIDRAVAKLKLIHFVVTVGSDGAAKVVHSEVPADNEQMAKGLAQIYGGMEQMASGFFQTWSVFVVNPPLPDLGTEFTLLSDADYSLTYKDGLTDVSTLMSKEYAVTTLKVTSAEFVSVIRPRFSKTSKGYLLNAYDADYEGTGGKDKTELHVAIEHQMIGGLQVPKNLNLKGSYNGSAFQVEVAFTGCSASKH